MIINFKVLNRIMIGHLVDYHLLLHTIIIHMRNKLQGNHIKIQANLRLLQIKLIHYLIMVQKKKILGL